MDKIPPHSLEAEMSVLGSMLIDESIAPDILDNLQASAFYLEKHKLIFSVISGLFKKRLPIDLLTVREGLIKHNKLEHVGGAAYLASLASSVATAVNARYYAEIVKDKYNKREMIKLAMELQDMAYAESSEASEIIIAAEKKICEINTKENKVQHIGELIDDAFGNIEKSMDSHDRITGLSSGLQNLDAITRGFHNQESIIVAGYSGQGKSSFAGTIAINVGKVLNVPVLIFNLETSKITFTERIICGLSKFNKRALTEGYYSTNFHRLTAGAEELRSAKIYIDETPKINPTELRIKTFQAKMRHGIKLVIIDYLQLMNSGIKGSQSDQLSFISSEIKSLAKELDVPIITLSQLTEPERQGGGGTKKGKHIDSEPQLWNIRGSGTIRNDADLIIFIHKGKLIVKKQKDGPTGDVPIRFIPEYTLFEDADEYEEERKDIV